MRKATIYMTAITLMIVAFTAPMPQAYSQGFSAGPETTSGSAGTGGSGITLDEESVSPEESDVGVAPTPPSTPEPRTPPQIYIPSGTSPLATPTGDFTQALSQDTFLKQTSVQILNTIANFFIGLSVLFLVITGLEYILARGEDEKIRRAHWAALWTLGGVLVILFAYAIIGIINTLF